MEISRFATVNLSNDFKPGGGIHWLFTLSVLESGSILHQVLFPTSPGFLKLSTHLKIMIRARNIFRYGVWKFLLPIVMDCAGTYHCTLSRISQIADHWIYMSLFWHMISICVCLGQKTRSGKAWQRNYIFYKLHSCKFYVTYKQTKIILWLKFYNHLVCRRNTETVGVQEGPLFSCHVFSIVLFS